MGKAPKRLDNAVQSVYLAKVVVRTMKILGKFKCPKCGFVQNGISESDAVRLVEYFNAYLDTLSKDEQEQWYGSTRVSIDQYKHCLLCGNSSSDFVQADPLADEAMTNQLIVAPVRPCF